MPTSLPATLARYVAAQNAHDAEAVAACFAPGATVHDEHRDHVGHEAIRAWVDDTSRRYGVTMEPLVLKRENEQQVLTAKVSGSFPGSPATLTFRFRLDAEQRIAALEIG